jgi:ribosomal protein S18 acetylase RimI-like enzyme
MEDDMSTEQRRVTTGTGIAQGIELRTAMPADVPEMLTLLRSAAEEGDALPFVDGLDPAFVRGQWLDAHGCVVARGGGTLLGMYRYGSNMPGRGAHICTATFVVRREARGQGIGRALVAHCLDAARAAGYRAMQFNQVVDTNVAAIRLYRSLGFVEIGRVPEAFRHDELGYLSALVMYRTLA